MNRFATINVLLRTTNGLSLSSEAIFFCFTLPLLPSFLSVSFLSAVEYLTARHTGVIYRRGPREHALHITRGFYPARG